MQLLGGLSAEQFLTEYWQKKPLLVRQAVPGFQGLIDPAGLNDLACRDDAISRIVRFEKQQWQLAHGPFDRRQLKHWQQGAWTILVSNLNHFLPEAAKLFYQFQFIPFARLDDLMVSYAPEGGGVGPHFDSYDVFLLQAGGRKRWQISAQADQTFIEDAPIRVLKDFQSEQEWVLEPGDMLYLPPKYAHHGIALEPGMTYSIGFRAPSTQELATQFMTYLQDHISLQGMYTDPDLQPQQTPAEIHPDMIAKVQQMLTQLTWQREDIAAFLGTYLSEPKTHVFFESPETLLDFDDFLTHLEKHGLILDLKTQMLYTGNDIFCNGEVVCHDPSDRGALCALANQRHLQIASPSDELAELLYEWYECGYLNLG